MAFGRQCDCLRGARIPVRPFSRSFWRCAVLMSVMGSIPMFFAIHPALDAIFASLKSTLSEPTPLYSDPYPFKINLLIYTTFIEPTFATFVGVSFCWPALGGRRVQRILAFSALLLLVRGRFIALFVESFWVQQPLPTAFLAESQFFLETLTMSCLVTLAWSYAVRIQCGLRTVRAHPYS